MEEAEAQEQPTPESVDFGAVARVAGQIEIVDVTLLSWLAALKVDPTQLSKSWDRSVKLSFNARTASWAEDRSAFVALVGFSATYDGNDETEIDVPGDRGARQPKEIELVATFRLVYSLSDPVAVSDKDVDQFVFFNSTFNAWPYWRELVQSTTGRMGITTLVLPIFRVPPVTPSGPPE